MMNIDIVEEDVASLDAYATIPVRFDVRSVARARKTASSSDFVFEERSLPIPFVKDYDAVPGNSPLGWPRRFDVSGWGFLAARSNGVRVGGAAILISTSEKDLAELWDLRVSPDARGEGVGSALLESAECWASHRGARRLQAETQNINVPACRFYAQHGFTLEVVNDFAYPNLPGETQFLWCKTIVTA
jgi:GNAT superfamily N-acetyltransferase